MVTYQDIELALSESAGVGSGWYQRYVDEPWPDRFTAFMKRLALVVSLDEDTTHLYAAASAPFEDAGGTAKIVIFASSFVFHVDFEPTDVRPDTEIHITPRTSIVSLTVLDMINPETERFHLLSRSNRLRVGYPGGVEFTLPFEGHPRTEHSGQVFDLLVGLTGDLRGARSAAPGE